MIPEYSGLPRNIPTADDIRNKPELVESYLINMNHALATYVQNIIQSMNQSAQYVPSRLGVGREPTDELDVVGTGTFTAGIYLYSPNGNRWILTVSNAGALVITAA